MNAANKKYRSTEYGKEKSKMESGSDKSEGERDNAFFWIVCIRNENGRPIVWSPTLWQQLPVEDTVEADLLMGEHLMV